PGDDYPVRRVADVDAARPGRADGARVEVVPVRGDARQRGLQAADRFARIHRVVVKVLVADIGGSEGQITVAGDWDGGIVRGVKIEAETERLDDVGVVPRLDVGIARNLWIDRGRTRQVQFGSQIGI